MELTGFIEKSRDPSKTFETFMEGENNRFARAMALAAGENPATTYNPLYIYGGRGVGKSHLLNAMADHSVHSGIKVLFGRIDREKKARFEFDGCPQMLIIDDLPFYEFADTEGLRGYVEYGGQLVISGSASPEDMPDSPVARFIEEKGISADIQPPEEELRVAILKARAEAEGISLPDDAAQFIAGHIKGSLHSLLGGLQRVRAMSSLSGQSITRFSAIQALKDYLWHEEEKEVG